MAAFTVEYVPGEEEERQAFRSQLGMSLARMRRKLTKYNQQDVADALGVDIESYARIERGLREPRAYELLRQRDRRAGDHLSGMQEVADAYPDSHLFGDWDTDRGGDHLVVPVQRAVEVNRAADGETK